MHRNDHIDNSYLSGIGLLKEINTWNSKVESRSKMIQLLVTSMLEPLRWVIKQA